MPSFEILCLAASHKLRGTCIAGLRTDGGGWIRPCARTLHGELYPEHYCLHDGGPPRVLDVVRISFEGPEPALHQPENWIIDEKPWRLIHRGLPDNLAPLLTGSITRTSALLGDYSSRTAFEQFSHRRAASSLALVAPTDLRWTVSSSPENRRKPRAIFRVSGRSYNLPVTDPAYVGAFRRLPLGTHPIHAVGIDPAMRILLTVSLGEPFEDGYCYKLVAAIVALAPDAVIRPEVPMTRAASDALNADPSQCSLHESRAVQLRKKISLWRHLRGGRR